MVAVRCQLLIDRLNKEVESFAVVKKEGVGCQIVN
jgi:hypothetical protein